MIGHSYRFHGRGGIQRLYKGGKSVRTGSLSLRYAPNPRRTSYRLAVVVSRKVSKSAVVRNRIRRRIYENVRILYNDLPVPFDLVFIAYDESVATLPADKLTAEITKLLQKAGVTSAAAAPHDIVEPKE